MKAFVFSVYGDHAELMKCHDVSEKEGFPAKRDPYAEPDRGEDIVIPAEYQGKPVTKIGPMAFFGPDIRSVQIPETVSLIHRYAFSCCEDLAMIRVSEKNPHFKSIDGILFSPDGRKLLRFRLDRNGGSTG